MTISQVGQLLKYRVPFCLLIASFFFTSFHAAHANTCSLLPHKKLVIACTVNCAETYRKALSAAALNRGYQIEITQLRSLPCPENDFACYFKKADAIVSPGGHDIDIKYWKNAVPQSELNKSEELFRRLANDGKPQTADEAARDAFEYGLFNYYFSNSSAAETPVLGICYGMQMLSVVNGAALHVDINEELKIPSRRKVNDEVIASSTKGILRQLAGTSAVAGYKNHHQAVNKDSVFRIQKERMRITGFSNGGHIPEVLEFSDRPLALGTQFHPERSAADVSDKFLGFLLEKACLKKQRESADVERDAIRVTEELNVINKMACPICPPKELR